MVANRMPVIIPSAKCACYIFTSMINTQKNATQALIPFKFSNTCNHKLGYRLHVPVVQSISCDMSCCYRHFYKINTPPRLPNPFTNNAYRFYCTKTSHLLQTLVLPPGLPEPQLGPVSFLLPAQLLM